MSGTDISRPLTQTFGLAALAGSRLLYSRREQSSKIKKIDFQRMPTIYGLLNKEIRCE